MIGFLCYQVKQKSASREGDRSMKVAIKQHKNLATPAEIDGQDHLIAVIPKARWPELPYKETLMRRTERHGADNGPLVTVLPNARDTHVSLARIAPELSRFELLTLARKLTAAHWQSEHAPSAVAVVVAGFDDAVAARIVEAITAALLAKSQPLPSYKSKKKSLRPLKRIDIFGMPAGLGLARTLAEAAGNHLARALTVLPPNELTPARYRERTAALAAEHGWAMRFLDSKTLRRMKAGAFLAVAQGSAAQDDGIVHLRYTPKERSKAGSKKSALALVGKGICFDTGGHNLKPAKHMLGMHEDMAGSAVALGTLLALTKLKVDFPVDCWLALAQNMISPQAYKQNDIVTAMNGTTIEVVHTDAEGRMVLADTLALACREKPAFLIDYATLTGACMYALGTSYSGAFTNRAELLDTLIRTGVDTGERVWPFPSDSDYDEALESDIADIKQCTLEGEADHILAARFLRRFVDEQIPWLHLDLASASHKGGLAHIPTATTGFGVRYTLELVLEKGVMSSA